MPMLSKLDALVVLVAAAVGMAIVEDRNRTAIDPRQPARAVVPTKLETCLELAEYRRRAARVMLIMGGGLPDIIPQAQARSVLAACRDFQAPEPDQPPGH